jgi:hypothetical protein
MTFSFVISLVRQMNWLVIEFHKSEILSIRIKKNNKNDLILKF